MTGRQVRASIVIPAYAGRECLARCLDSISANVSDAVAHDVLVVLNGPAIDAPSTSLPHDRVDYIRSDVNLGFAGACNLGVAASEAEFVVLLNDDATVLPGWLEALVRTADRCPRAAAIGSLNLSPDGTLSEAGSVAFSDGSCWGVGRGATSVARWDYVRRVDHCSASSLLVRRSAWDEVGGLDEQFFPAYYEDLDLCAALSERGHDVLYEPRSRIVHELSRSTGRDFRSLLFRRNSARFAGKWPAWLAARRTAPAAATFERDVALAAHRARQMRRRILLIDDRPPSEGIGSGFSRALSLLEQSADHGFAVDLAVTAVPPATSDTLRDLGVWVVTDDLMSHLAQPEIVYDAVIISRPHNFRLFAAGVRRLQPQAAVIADFEALWHRRIERRTQLVGPAKDSVEAVIGIEAMMKMEHDMASRADACVCVSAQEQAMVVAHAGHTPVVVIEPRRGSRAGDASFRGRDDMVFVAGWLAGEESPNVDALRWFAQQVLPDVVARIPWAKLVVCGAEPPRSIREFGGTVARAPWLRRRSGTVVPTSEGRREPHAVRRRREGQDH